MINIEMILYDEYTAFTSPNGSFDPFEFPMFVRETSESRADIAFGGNIRILPDGSLNRAYFTDESLELSGKEAIDLIQNERWLVPRLFGILVRTSFLEAMNVQHKSEMEQILLLVSSAKKVLVYGGYVTYLDCRHDVSSLHCANPMWLSENPVKIAFAKPFTVLPPQTGQPRVFILGTPEHANLGDQAILYAMNLFVKSILSDVDVIEISESGLSTKIDVLRKAIKPQDLIFLMGGGNLGDLYLGPNKAREIAIKNFPQNQIIIFPQSVFFQQREALEETKALFSLHTKITLCAREKRSYLLMKECFPNTTILLTPDIVFTLNIRMNALKRKGVMLVMRLDKEGLVSFVELTNIKTVLYKRFDEVTFTDTIIRCEYQDQEKEINKKLRQFCETELVVTDRLHGAIFAAITGTPCVLLPNSYHKVESTYEWLEQLKYIRLCRDFSELDACIDSVFSFSGSSYDSEYYRTQFGVLAKRIMEWRNSIYD